MMKNEELIEVVIDLATAILKSGGKSSIENTTIIFEYKSLHMELGIPRLRLTFMGSEVDNKGWPYDSVIINGKHYRFQPNTVIPQDFIDHIAKSIDQLRQDVFVSTQFTPLIEEEFFRVTNMHIKKPNRETYMLKEKLRDLFIQEAEFHRLKRKNANKENKSIYQRFLHIKNRLPHSLKYVRNPLIRLKKLAEQYYQAQYQNGDLVVTGWGNDPYQSIRMLEQHLREELSEYGKNIHTMRVLRTYYNLFDEDIDDIKKKLSA
jgi:hypothetical protein